MQTYLQCFPFLAGGTYGNRIEDQKSCALRPHLCNYFWWEWHKKAEYFSEKGFSNIWSKFFSTTKKQK